MNDYLTRKLRERCYLDKPDTMVFEKRPVVVCRYTESGETLATFELGAITKVETGYYDIIYADIASDGCSYFGPQNPTSGRYIFEINGHCCKNVPELLEYAKILEHAQSIQVQDEIEFMDI